MVLEMAEANYSNDYNLMTFMNSAVFREVGTLLILVLV
jgi:hypothetical protein